eukprot:53096_1
MSWIQLNNTLSTAKIDHRSIVIDSSIYIIGGVSAISYDYLTNVDVLDTKTNEIWSYSNMIYGMFSFSAIEVNFIIYVFAGEPSTNQYYQETNLFPSLSPTATPTIPPSNAPSISPTNSPTIPPTISPSHSPTITPSSSPSFPPTRYPTSINQYQWKFPIEYYIKNLFQNDIDKLKSISNDIVSLIETVYVNTANEIKQKLEYKK